MEPRLYTINLIDYATPSFISCPNKPYWGTPDELARLLEALIRDNKADALIPGKWICQGNSSFLTIENQSLCVALG